MTWQALELSSFPTQPWTQVARSQSGVEARYRKRKGGKDYSQRKERKKNSVTDQKGRATSRAAHLIARSNTMEHGKQNAGSGFHDRILDAFRNWIWLRTLRPTMSEPGFGVSLRNASNDAIRGVAFDKSCLPLSQFEALERSLSTVPVLPISGSDAFSAVGTR